MLCCLAEFCLSFGVVHGVRGQQLLLGDVRHYKFFSEDWTIGSNLLLTLQGILKGGRLLFFSTLFMYVSLLSFFLSFFLPSFSHFFWMEY